MRIDKWLWAARFFKTRGLSQAEIENGRVRINDQIVRASREVAVGNLVAIHTRDLQIVVTVRGLSGQRGPARVAQALYEETAASTAAREAARQAASAQWAAQGAVAERPTKRDRRQRDAYQDSLSANGSHNAEPEWNARWTARAPG